MNQQDKNMNGDGHKLPVRGLVIWLLLLALFLTTFQVLSQGKEEYTTVAWTPAFVTMVKDGRIRECEVVMDTAGGNQFIRGEYLDANGKLSRFKVHVVVTEYTQKWLDENKVSYSYKAQNPFIWQLLQGIIPFLLVLGLLYFLFMRQMKMAGRGAMSFGKSRARLLSRDRNKVTFADVAGVDEAKEEVQEIVEFLRDPKRFQKLGGRIPKGVLLVGPPGTGKTLLAKAIAGQAEVPFFSISGSDFVEMFVGVGASRVRDMFEQGKKNAPCIIFIDEIDAVGRSRFSGFGGGHDEREQTLNALLVEMDGFDTQEGVIIIAATNRPDVLDQALLRPGRFDRQIHVELPHLDGREHVLRIHTRKIKLGANVDLHRVARGTPGFSGADLANLVNEAALLAARRGADVVEIQDLEEARDKVRWGRERRSRMLDEKEKELTACHEAGHALVLALLDNTEPLHKVTIIPRGASLGSTMQLPEKDRYTESKSKLESMLIGIMGGRAAEEIVFGDITTGAQNDLRQATHLARMMVCEWGMSPSIGPQYLGESQEVLWLGREVSRTHNMSEQTALHIDKEISRMLSGSYAEALRLIRENRDKLDTITRLLIERETLDGADIDEILKHGRLLSTAERGGATPPDVSGSPPPATMETEAVRPPPESFPGASKADAHA